VYPLIGGGRDRASSRRAPPVAASLPNSGQVPRASRSFATSAVHDKGRSRQQSERIEHGSLGLLELGDGGGLSETGNRRAQTDSDYRCDDNAAYP
jgi:hypothetical protein